MAKWLEITPPDALLGGLSADALKAGDAGPGRAAAEAQAQARAAAGSVASRLAPGDK